MDNVWIIMHDLIFPKKKLVGIACSILQLLHLLDNNNKNSAVSSNLTARNVDFSNL